MQCDGCGRLTRIGYPQNLEQTIMFCFGCQQLANQDRRASMEHNLVMMNDASNQTEQIFGLPPSDRYLPRRDTYIKEGDTNNHINISNSAVGAINTGVVGTLNAALDNVSVGSPELAAEIKSLAEKIGESDELKTKDKEEALEALTFLGAESQKEPGARNKTLIKASGKVLMATLSLAANLQTLAPVAVKMIAETTK